MRFVAAVARGADAESVKEAIRQTDPADVVIIVMHAMSQGSRRISHLIVLECSEEVATKITENKVAGEIEGLYIFEKEIQYQPC